LNDFRFPAGLRLERLPAGTGTEVVVMAPLVSGEMRVPVKWGHSYNANASRWQEIREDAIAWYRMRDFRGRGALYTDHVTGIVR